MADIYQLQAIYFANVLYQQEGVVACVHLEGDKDKLFWNSILQSQRPGYYYFITNSRSLKKDDAGGRGQCLKYKPYLNKRFFIGIDSDMHFLLREPEIEAAHYICQTYTYSWENHYCEARALQKRFEEQCPEKANVFNYSIFLEAYSKVVYKPLLLLLHCIRNGKSDFTRHLFHDCLPHQCQHDDIKNNGATLVYRIAMSFEPYLNASFTKDVDLDAEANYYKALGLTEENAYLHVRGHNLYDLVKSIGDMLCGRTGILFDNDILKRDIPPFNYWQIEKVANDIATIVC